MKITKEMEIVRPNDKQCVSFIRYPNGEFTLFLQTKDEINSINLFADEAKKLAEFLDRGAAKKNDDLRRALEESGHIPKSGMPGEAFGEYID